MNISQLKEELKYFYEEEIGIIVYFILKNGDGITIKMADIDSEIALPQLKDYFLESINNRIIEANELQIMNISDADERKNVIFEYNLEEKPVELGIISEVMQNEYQPIFNFHSDDITNLKGYIIALGDCNRKLLLYKQHYTVSLIKRDSFLFYKADERFVKFDEDLIRLDKDFQFFSLDGTLFIKDLDKLEKFFGFHEVIKREALNTINRIESINILESVEELKNSLDDIAFARKLTKLSSNSPVLGVVPIPSIISFTKNNPALSGKFTYNHDQSKIILKTKVSQNLFVKLLNDDYLKSELTNDYYDSLAKDKIALAEA